MLTTLNHIVAMLPTEEREIGRMRLAEALRAVVSQQLLPRKDDKGRVPALDLLVATPRARECLRDPAKLGALREVMASGGDTGMRTFEQHLVELVKAGTVAAETALAASLVPSPADDVAAPAGRSSKRGKGG